MSTASNVMTVRAGSAASPPRPLHHARPKTGLLSLCQLFLAGIFHLSLASARPALGFVSVYKEKEDAPKTPDDPSMWIYLGTAIALVLIGGAFAGLTIALMGQDEVYLQVISTSGEGAEKKHARKVLNLLRRGKHWVLVTLLVGNVITNETLPIVLDRSIGGGYAAAITSTILVIVFGEIVPQSICVRYGLPIGAWMAPIVLLLMWIFAPISWPIARLLDRLLGEDHGTTYKKAGLKTLVTLHKTMNTAQGERLNEDEVHIISGVLDLKAKPVGSIMTPMNDVFTLSADAVLDEEMIDTIMHEGYSRIPVYEPSNKHDFVGMLLVKMLITYDPEDGLKVSDFILATLPETRPDTSCLDIINFFQQGKSHMVLVSDYPGEPVGALGVVTLEDVIEELIGEEIIDESDVYIDVHKAIRRMQPAPTHRHRSRVSKGDVVMDAPGSQATAEENLIDVKDAGEGDPRAASPSQKRLSSTSLEIARNSLQRAQTFVMRRTNSAGSGSEITTVQMRPYTSEIKEQLRNIGPSNVASRPKQSLINTVKVKPGVGSIPEHRTAPPANQAAAGRIIHSPPPSGAQVGTGHDLVSPGHSAKDGVQAMQAGYGTVDRGSSSSGNQAHSQAGATKHKGTQASRGTSVATSKSERKRLEQSHSHSTLGSMYASDDDSQRRSKSRSKPRKPTTARSGSITENLVDAGGVKKLVLELSSSSEDAGDGESIARAKSSSQAPSQVASRAASQRRGNDGDVPSEGYENGDKKKKKRRRPKKKKQHDEEGTHEETGPLMGRH